MHEVSAGVIVYFEEKSNYQFLLLHYEAGHWDLPKGHIEKDENLKETALRETKEETGLNVKLHDDFKKSISYFFRRDSVLVGKSVHFYLGKADSQSVNLSNEHIGYEWLDFEEAIKRLTYDNAKEILKAAHKHLTQRTLTDY